MALVFMLTAISIAFFQRAEFVIHLLQLVFRDTLCDDPGSGLIP